MIAAQAPDSGFAGTTESSLSGRGPQTEPAEQRIVVDMHAHVGMSGSPYETEGIETCMRLARRAGIDWFVNLTNLGGGAQLTYSVNPDAEHVRASNEMGCEVARRHPQFFVPFCFLNPTLDTRDIDEEIDRCIRKGPCRGIKLWIATRANDPRLDPIMRQAAELGVPVLQHAWDDVIGQRPGESTPDDVAELAARHPATTIIMAHLIGCGWRGVAAVAPHPNVWVDTAGGQPAAGLIEYAAEQMGADRVVFGSDWPIRDFATKRALVEGADIPERDKRLILGGNAIRLLKLSEMEGAGHA